MAIRELFIFPNSITIRRGYFVHNLNELICKCESAQGCVKYGCSTTNSNNFEGENGIVCEFNAILWIFTSRIGWWFDFQRHFKSIRVIRYLCHQSVNNVRKI